MSTARRLASLLALATLAGACSTADGPTALAPAAATLSKSGTAPSGGSGGGGGGGGGGSDSSTNSPTSGGIPVAPSFTGRIDSIGAVPTTVYYGSPSEWTIGGYVFEGNYLTHLKPANGPFVVGACVSVTFYTTYTGAYMASEIKTELASKCN